MPGAGPELSGLLDRFRDFPDWLGGAGGWDLLDERLPIVSFDLSGVPEGLGPVAGAACIETLWGLVVSDPRPRVVLVDDCSRFFSSRGCSEVLDAVVKRARKFRLGVVNVSTDLGFFLWGSPVGGRSLLQNSALKTAFGPGQGFLGPVSDVLGISQGGREFLSGASPGQGVVVVDVSGDFCVSGNECFPGELDILVRAGLC